MEKTDHPLGSWYEDELEASIDGLLDEFALYIGSILTLSDYAVSREGIYEDHL